LILPLVDPIIKNNVIIALGDLVHRHPIIIEPYLTKLYDCLRDKDTNVKKTSLLVLAHLILNDALKIREELPELVNMLFDPADDIRNYAKLFFHELCKKDKHTIYNLLPAAISKLSRPEDLGGVSKARFDEFCKALLGYIEKDSMSAGLTEKLLSRIAAIPVKEDKIFEIVNSKIFLA
jgi:condensin complex subunit 1